MGRIGVSIGALPAILPVNFELVGTNIVIRTMPGTRLAAATRRAVVAFEVDSFAADGSCGWSVFVLGVCAEVTDAGQRAALAGSGLTAWAFDGGEAERLVRIETSFVNGRRFSH